MIQENAFEHVICGMASNLVLVSMHLGTGFEIICTYVTR